MRRPQSTLLEELPLWVSIATVILFLLFGDQWLADLSNPLWLACLFVWLVGVVLWGAFAVVRHADCLAHTLGEPYGTLILTVSVISIEVAMISAVMLTGGENPTLARDTMYAVIMIVMNGMVGIMLLLGGIRYHEQQFNLLGAKAFFSLIIPLSVLGLVLPSFTESTIDATLTSGQTITLIALTIALYVVFLGVQTMRHRAYFLAPEDERVENDEAIEHDHLVMRVRPVGYHVACLVAYLVPIVLLAKKLAVPLEYSISVAGAPAALGGVLVAAIVLSPEGLAAVKAALQNRLQRSVNLSLGSVVATIGLTIPAVLIIGLVLDTPVVLGLDAANVWMLLLTLGVGVLTFGSSRTNVLQGAVHLVLFVAYIVLIFD